MGSSVSCGGIYASSRSKGQKSSFDGGFGRNMQVRFWGGYVAAGGKGFRTVCKGPEGQLLQGFLLPFVFI